MKRTIKTVDRAEIERLVGLVEGKLKGLPPIENNYDQYFRDAEKALTDLAKENDGRRAYNFDYAYLSLGGIKTSCTAGAAGAMRNWLKAARKRLEATP